ncbi:MAG: hypothetical protein WDN69_16245 [Aliidongia sp.]
MGRSSALAARALHRLSQHRSPDRQRLYNPSDLDPDLAIKLAEEPAPGRLRIVFTDGHETVFETATLLAEAARPALDEATPLPQPWTATLNTRPQADWVETADPAALRHARCLSALWLPDPAWRPD